MICMEASVAHVALYASEPQALQQSHQRLQLSCKLQRGAQVIASGPRKRVKLMEPAPQRDVTERDLSPNGGQGIPRLACRESAPSRALFCDSGDTESPPTNQQTTTKATK